MSDSPCLAALRRLLCRGLAALLAVLVLPAAAHELSMAEMEIRQASPSEYLWQWAAGPRSGDNALQPRWPEGCADDAGVVRCGGGGLSGRLAIDGVGKRYSAVLLRLYWLDGQTRVYTLTSAQPAVQLFGSADDRRGWGDIAAAYTLLGIEHILGGYDHLMFVVGLLFLVGFERRLVWTITAFTAAHSLTLASSALGWLVLRPPPVEATIALSIMLVAGEALHQRPTLARRWPALVAFLFGLVHGLGFAGALKEIGLPEQHLPLALLTFNLGVELGQLAAVAVCWVAYRALRSLPTTALARRVALYLIGSMAAYWSIGRVLAIAG